MNWLERILPGIPDRLVPTLKAFGGDVAMAPWMVDDQVSRIVSVLSAEVDEQQAAMFARRYQAVHMIIGGLEDEVKMAFSIGLSHRAWEILGGPAPHTLRLRALVDFYWSQCAVERHRHMNHPPLVDYQLEWQIVADGVEHAHIEGPTAQGPVHLNLLRVSPGRRMRAVDCRGQGTLVDVTRRHRAIAGISGGFFLYSEPDIAPHSQRRDPVGLLVSDGRVLNPPIFPRSAIIQHKNGDFEVKRVVMDVLTRSTAKVGPPTDSVAVVGFREVARGSSVAVPLNGYVAPSQVHWAPGSIRDAMAGGPALLGLPEALNRPIEGFCGTAPPVTFAHDETGDTNLLPRMAVGVDEQGRLIATAVDGRNFERAPGFTLGQLAQFMRQLGCIRAMNLDGGSSKRMVIAGRQVDLSTTEVVSGAPKASTHVRPVNTALLFS